LKPGNLLPYPTNDLFLFADRDTKYLASTLQMEEKESNMGVGHPVVERGFVSTCEPHAKASVVKECSPSSFRSGVATMWFYWESACVVLSCLGVSICRGETAVICCGL
jgi:hypothetical protein